MKKQREGAGSVDELTQYREQRGGTGTDGTCED